MTTVKAAKARLLKYALAKANATLDHPWGENVAKVRGKVFVAKSLPFVEAMGYGLGRSGWVSVKAPKGAMPLEMYEEWIDESYMNVAPKRKAARVSSAAPKARARRAARPARARRTTSRSSGR